MNKAIFVACLLVLAVVVSAVLVLNVSKPSFAVLCASSDPLNLTVKGEAFSYGDSYVNCAAPLNPVEVVNVSGGAISGINCIVSEGFLPDVQGCPQDSVDNGKSFYLTLVPVSPSGSRLSPEITLNYTDSQGQAEWVDITCASIVCE